MYVGLALIIIKYWTVHVYVRKKDGAPTYMLTDYCLVYIANKFTIAFSTSKVLWEKCVEIEE